jgi:hypothetical protein
MNTVFSKSRFTLNALSQNIALSAAAAVVFVVMIGLLSGSVFAADKPLNDDVCATRWTRIALRDDVVSIYSGSVDGAPNGLLVAQFELSAIPGITDEQRASNKVISLLTQNLESAEGWTVNLYWHQDRYGVAVSGPVTATVDGVTTTTAFWDDTGAKCVL